MRVRMLLRRRKATTRKSITILASVSAYYELAWPHATKESDDDEVCVSAYSCICVRILLYMCPHTTMCPHICVPAYSKEKQSDDEKVSTLAYVCPHTTVCVRILMCPHTTICVSPSYYVCVRILVYVSAYCCICVRIRSNMRTHR